MKVTHFDSVDKYKGVLRSITLQELTESKETESKEHAPLFCTFLSSNDTAQAADITQMTGLTLDIDEGAPKSRLRALRMLSAFHGVVYTTHSHTKTDPRFRAVLPCSIPVAEYQALSSSLAEYLASGKRKGLTCQRTLLPATKNYYPSHKPGSQNFQILTNNPTALKLESHRNTSFEKLIEVQNTLYGRHKSQDDEERKEWIANLREALPLCAKSNRHNAWLYITGLIANFDATLDPWELAVLCRPSFDSMNDADPDDPLDYEKEVAKPYEKACEYIEEGQWDKPGIKTESPEGLPYLVNNKSTVFVLDPERMKYLQETRASAFNAIQYVLSDRIVLNTKKGFRSYTSIFGDHGVVAERIVLDGTTTVNDWDAKERTLTLASIPKRTLEPAFHPDVDEWLRMLGKEHYPKLQDWLACVPDLSKPICGLYIHGAPGSAKTKLAEWISRIWKSEAAVPLKSFLSDFNSRAQECPIVFADETLPGVSFSENKKITGDLREIVTQEILPLKIKQLSEANLRACIRLVMASNPDNLLEAASIESRTSFEALAERFFVLEATPDVAKFMVNLGKKKRWDKDAVARHVLWIAANHEVKEPQGRLWVTGTTDTMRRILFKNSSSTSSMCQWVYEAINNRSGMFHNVKLNESFVVRGTGETMRVAVRMQALMDTWKFVFPYSKLPAIRLKSNLSVICKQTKNTEYWEVDMNLVRMWAEDMKLKVEEQRSSTKLKKVG